MICRIRSSLFAAVIMAFMLMGVGSALAAEVPSETLLVRIGAKEDGQPYIFKENGEVKGFEADLWKEIAKRANLKLEYKYNSISGLFGLLDNGEIDTITHFLGITPQRKKKYDFSDSYGSGALQFMTKKGTPEVTSIEGLYGKKVGVALGSAAAGVIKTFDPDEKIKVVPYEEFRHIPQDVDMGRIYAYFGNPITMMGDIRKMGIDCKIDPLVLLATPVGYPYVRGNENSQRIMDRVNLVLEELRKDGTISKISMEWFGLDITSFSGMK